MVKKCLYHPELRCYFSACSGLDKFGNVVHCGLISNPDGRSRPRIVVGSPLSIYDLWKGRVERRSGR